MFNCFCTLPIALSSTSQSSVTQEILCFPWFLQDLLWRQQLGSFDRRRLSYPEDVEKVIKLVQEASRAGHCLFSFYMWIHIYNSCGRPFRKLTPFGLCEQLHFEAFVNFCQVDQGRVKCQPRPQPRKPKEASGQGLTGSLSVSLVLSTHVSGRASWTHKLVLVRHFPSLTTFGCLWSALSCF